jgi:hypothetical protein
MKPCKKSVFDFVTEKSNKRLEGEKKKTKFWLK